MKVFFLALILITSCGQKKPAPPLKRPQETSQLQMSPRGVSQVQELFNVYSPAGKLSIEEIKNITHKISPKFAAHLKNLNLSPEPGKKMSASEFFLLLGESNRTLLWAVTFDLQSKAGWSKLLKSEFPWSDPGLLAETQALVSRLLSTPDYLSHALKIGGVYNFLDATEPTTGSVLDAITKRMIAAHSTEAKPELTPETLRLVKFTFVLKYVLKEIEKKSPLTSTLDSYADWSLRCIEDLMEKNYPGLKKETLAQLMQEGQVSVTSKKNAKPEDLHATLHPEAFQVLGPSEEWSAYDIYQLVKSTCKKAELPTTLAEWQRFFETQLVRLDYTDPSFCEDLKGSVQEFRAADSRQPAGHKSYRAAPGRSHRSAR